MKKGLILNVALVALLTSCSNGGGNTAWEETKTLGRYITHTGKKLLRKDTDSRLIVNHDQLRGPVDEEEFVALENNAFEVDEVAYAQPQADPSPSTYTPNLSAAWKPDKALASIFQIVHFDTDKHVFTNPEYSATLSRIAQHLKNNSKLHVFVLGHCDERASEAYNTALSTRRANYVRQELIKAGVNQNRIFAVPCGKEMPLDLGHTRSSWAKNRRVEFKLYEAD
ncbi:MAG: OmpA family protein [Simkaniaceae bacterium]|nr:OmpA family protein [Simkaniaceae bacterium]